MISAMVTELLLRKDYLPDEPLQSIYFGGGTPSLLQADELKLIMETVQQHKKIQANAEITFEVNPDNVSEAHLKLWKSAGINRLSIGVQGFDDAELSWMNRAHDSRQSVEAIKMAKQAGFDNISLDLIYGSRFQTLQSWQHTLEQAIALEPQHISAYNLTVEERTVLGHRVSKGLEPPIDDELGSQLFLELLKTLAKAGFEQYEISNFARPGFRAVHNSSYWKQAPYLGIGPSAHSYNTESRQWNVRNNSAYIKAIQNGQAFFEIEKLSPATRFNEYVMTRLRTAWGCNGEEMIRLFGVENFRHFLSIKKDYAEFFNEVDNQFSLNERGRLHADGIASAFFILEES